MTTVRLPLFPLNSVLFPGLVIPLNVFEERYRAMMRELLKTPEDEPRRFAVVTIRDGHEVAPSAQGLPDQTALPERGPTAGFGDDPVKAFHSVGCVADAATIRERADGTSRCWPPVRPGCGCCRWTRAGPFLTAELEELEDPGDEAGALAEGVLRAFRQYQKRLAGARERSLSTGAELPDEPSVVSYLVAAAMMLDVPSKQRLLQAPDTASRLREELTLLRTETAIIRNLPSLPAVGPDPRPDEPQLTHARSRMAKKSKKQQSGGTPATVALTAAGVAVHGRTRTSTTPRHPSYGEEAAEAMGVSPERVFKTLVADVDGA